MRRALIIVDVQNDFCPGGAVAVQNGDQVIPVINGISPKFDKVVATQDWHPPNHVSFAKMHDKGPFETVQVDEMEQFLWPDHCVQNSPGAALHKDLNLGPVNMILKKGTRPDMDSYSAFKENDHKTSTGLGYYLKGFEVPHVYISGLATDVCAYYSAIDAQKEDFAVHFILDATKGIDQPQGSVDKALTDMRSKGIKIIQADDV